MLFFFFFLTRYLKVKTTTRVFFFFFFFFFKKNTHENFQKMGYFLPNFDKQLVVSIRNCIEFLRKDHGIMCSLPQDYVVRYLEVSKRIRYNKLVLD